MPLPNFMNLVSKIGIAFLMFSILACKNQEKREEPAATTVVKEYTEKHRPQIHFSPKEKWMNDPNGMFYLDGEYNLFYQYYPDSTVWGPMHWGHAVSKDLVHWEHLPIALFPDSLGYIFSGSAVVDTDNTSGFGSKEKPPVIAIFTYHDPEGERSGKNDFQTQGIAYSTDKGRTWKKYEDNPVLKNPGIRDFRDPKVSWIDESKQWVMTLAVKDHIEFYGSPDLKTWKKLSEFGQKDGTHDGVWECPDLFKLRDEKGNSKFVLFVSVNPGAPNGGSGTQFFVGNFDGKKFINESPGKNAGWVDFGMDNYAGVTFSNIPSSDGRRITMGWMSNWLYAQVVPTEKWRSATTVPRALTLQTFDKGYVLKSTPVKELDELVYSTNSVEAKTEADTVIVFNHSNPGMKDSLGIPVIIKGAVRKTDFALELSNRKDQKVTIGFDPAKNEFFIDRGINMPSRFSKEFASRMTAPRLSFNEKIQFTAIVDVASVELFFDDGATTMTAITFPDEIFNKAKLFSRSGKITTDVVRVDYLKSIW